MLSFETVPHRPAAAALPHLRQARQVPEKLRRQLDGHETLHRRGEMVRGEEEDREVRRRLRLEDQAERLRRAADMYEGHKHRAARPADPEVPEPDPAHDRGQPAARQYGVLKEHGYVTVF